MPLRILLTRPSAPHDVAAVRQLLESVPAADIRTLVVFGKTEGAADLRDTSRHQAQAETAAAIMQAGGEGLAERSWSIFSTGCEGIATPVCVAVADIGTPMPSSDRGLVVGAARSAPLDDAQRCTLDHVGVAAACVRAAMANAALSPEEVALVLVKSPIRLADANAGRPHEVFGKLFDAMSGLAGRGFRRSTRDAVRLIDSTTIRLSGLASAWARWRENLHAAKAHLIYDPDAEAPLYLAVTPARVNDIVAARAMPVEPGATYVFDLGYYDFAWWAKLDAAGCRIVTRLKANTPITLLEERSLPESSPLSYDRVGLLPARQAASRKNPFDKRMREIGVVLDDGKTLRVVSNDLDASAQDIADLYKRRWAIELFFRWVKQTLKIKHFIGRSENAVRIQIAVALIAYLLLRLANDAVKITASPLAFARLVRANIMHRRDLDRLLKPPEINRSDPRQMVLDL